LKKHSSLVLIVLLSITIVFPLFVSQFQSAQANTSSTLAIEYLKEVLDKYHTSFDVYTDSSAAGNHFVLPAKMESDVQMDLNCASNPYQGTNCIENKFTGTGLSWGGWYLMNGVLQGDETQPKPNWGIYPNAGFNLAGATTLTFYAKGQNGGERVEFFAFGVGRNANTGLPVEDFPDSSPKTSLGYVTLNPAWTEYTLSLVGLDLSYVLGGFGWATNAIQNSNQPITFYLDDIKYDKARLNDPRFLVSYELLPTDELVLKNTAFTYDNALALLAFLSDPTQDNVNNARLIGDALVYAANNDRFFTDGRLRNAYQGGDLKLFPGWTPHGKTDTARASGWWDSQNVWFEDKSFVGTDTGNMAWTILALLSLYEHTHNNAYLNTSVKLGQWIETNCRDQRGAGGFTGGYLGWEQTINNLQGQTKLLWKSTEHNIDCYVAFLRLCELTGQASWGERALYAKNFVESMWDATSGHFWTGTTEDGITINTANIPADVQAWGLLALGNLPKYGQGLTWVESNCYVQTDGFKGFDFNNDKDGVWFEGTAHMVTAFQMAKNVANANLFLSELTKAQQTAQNANGKGLVAASHDLVSTGFTWTYSARLHVGVTSWFIFADLGYNPYWNTGTSLESITLNEVTVDSGGTGYTTPYIHLLGGGGTGATATARVSCGAIYSIVITNPGSGYTTPPIVVISDSSPRAKGAIASVNYASP
jgi:type II secretory pathway pseudopilin PulG